MTNLPVRSFFNVLRRSWRSLDHHPHIIRWCGLYVLIAAALYGALLPAVLFAASASPSQPQRMVTQAIRYRIAGASEAFLAWGINGWNVVPEQQRPVGTLVRDRVMYTPMVLSSGAFLATLHVPAGTTVDFAFQITKTQDGTSIEVWDANGNPKRDYHTLALADGVVDIQSEVELTPRPGSYVSPSFRWRSLFILMVGFGMVFGVSVWAAHRDVFAPARISWVYPGPDDGRDLRIDFLRGLAICNVVIDHIAIPSAYQILASERIGAITEAEGFVILSGVVLGMVYRKRVETQGWSIAIQKLLRRAIELYGAALFVVLSVFAISLIPLVDSHVITTYIDEASGTVYSLYGTGGGTGQFIADLLLLRYGPSQFNIMGLFVILTACTPIALWLLKHNRVALLLALSWGMYIAHLIHPVKILHSAFEYPFPLLAWQLFFFHGLAAGYYRRGLLDFMRGRYGAWALSVAIAVALTCMLFALNNPWVKVPNFMRMSFVPAGTFTQIYTLFFQRVDLGIGRAINAVAALMVAYAVLSRYWAPLNRALGWLFVPLGQASLYVFVVHVYFVLIVDRIAQFHHGNLLVNTLGHTMVVLAIWVMVRTKFLFRWVPQ